MGILCRNCGGFGNNWGCLTYLRVRVRVRAKITTPRHIKRLLIALIVILILIITTLIISIRILIYTAHICFLIHLLIIFNTFSPYLTINAIKKEEITSLLSFTHNPTNTNNYQYFTESLLLQAEGKTPSLVYIIPQLLILTTLVQTPHHRCL
jgi:hypothetical protein